MLALMTDSYNTRIGNSDDVVTLEGFPADAFNFQLTDMPDNVEDLRLIIQASAPQSNGISRAYSKVVQIGAAREVVDEMINIKDDYEAVHGAVTEAAPKVFLKYFYVNTKTGEKSGEMLANVKLG